MLQKIRGVFKLFDQDDNETITIRELGTCMRALGQNPTEAELTAIIAEIDADGNGIIEFPEFVDLMSRRPWGQQGSEEEVRTAFQQAFDVSSSGLLNAAQLRHLLTSMGETLTDEQLDEMLSQYPTDGDGMVKYEDFVKLMME